MSTFIKYQDIPYEDFLSALSLLNKKDIPHALISIDKLREVLFKGDKRKIVGGSSEVFPIKIFYIIDYDIIRNTHNYYFLFQSSSKIQEELERIAKRIKIELKLKNIDSLFRIDPKYGLVVGTSKDAIDPFVGLDKSYCFITLYLTNDHNHPEIALLEYVEKAFQKKYIEVFEKHNHCSPGTFKLLGIDFSKIKKAFVRSNPHIILNYEDLKELCLSFAEKQKIENLTLSFIYEEVSEEEANECILDKTKASFYPAGLCKFFINTEELLKA